MAVVLASGRGSRLGGTHKPALPVAGRCLLDHAPAVTDVPALPGESLDVATPGDLTRARAGPVTGSASQPSHW